MNSTVHHTYHHAPPYTPPAYIHTTMLHHMLHLPYPTLYNSTNVRPYATTSTHADRALCMQFLFDRYLRQAQASEYRWQLKALRCCIHGMHEHVLRSQARYMQGGYMPRRVSHWYGMHEHVLRSQARTGSSPSAAIASLEFGVVQFGMLYFGGRAKLLCSLRFGAAAFVLVCNPTNFLNTTPPPQDAARRMAFIPMNDAGNTPWEGEHFMGVSSLDVPQRGLTPSM